MVSSWAPDKRFHQPNSNLQETALASEKPASAITPLKALRRTEEEDMQKWFNTTYGVSVNLEEATKLIDARSRGSFLTEINRVLAAKKVKQQP